jgi:hypothetical protein
MKVLRVAGAALVVSFAATAHADERADALAVTPSPTLACVAGNETIELAAWAAAAAGCDLTGRLPYFAQAAAPWGNRPLGDLPLCEGDDASEQADAKNASCCMPYAASGCGPTSLAMVLRAYGERVTPLTVGEVAVKAGLRRCNVDGVSPAAIVATGKVGHYVVDPSLDGTSDPPPTQGDAAEARLARLENVLRAGKPVILGCVGCTVINEKGARRTLAGHYMVLSGVNADGTFSLLDPSGFDARTIERDEVRLHARLQYVRRADGAPVEACRW